MGAAIFSAVREKETVAFIQEGDVELDVRRSEANNIVNDPVRQAWDGAMTNAGLQHCTMANGFAAWFFKEGQLPKNKAFFRSRPQQAPTVSATCRPEEQTAERRDEGAGRILALYGLGPRSADAFSALVAAPSRDFHG
jgi:hypothetical protein